MADKGNPKWAKVIQAQARQQEKMPQKVIWNHRWIKANALEGVLDQPANSSLLSNDTLYT